MFIPIYQGQKYSYSYDAKSGELYLFRNDHSSHRFLKGKDARIFQKQIELIDDLPPPQCNDGRLTENIISIFVQ